MEHNPNSVLKNYGENLEFIFDSKYENLTLQVCHGIIFNFIFNCIVQSKINPILKLQDLGKEATQNWYDEVKLYDFERPGFYMNSFHFTQAMWKSSERVGFGLAYTENSFYIVANYHPIGNIINKNRTIGDHSHYYRLNVFEKIT